MNTRSKKVMYIGTIIVVVICFATANGMGLLSGNLVWVFDFICVALILLMIYSLVHLEK